jgi:hypothetical protein
MLDSTLAVLRDDPLAVPVFLAAVGYVLLALKQRRKQIARYAAPVAGLAGGVLFVALFLAELFGGALFYGLADAVISAEVTLGRWALAVIDAGFAAGLRVVLLVIAAVWTVVSETVAVALPAVTAQEFLVTVFGFEFLAGGAVVAALYWMRTDTAMNRWLLPTGVVLGAAGLLTLVAETGATALDTATFGAGLVAATTGLSLGFVLPILVVEPNFDPGRTPGTGLDGDGLLAGAADGGPGIVQRARGRIRSLWSGEE